MPVVRAGDQLFRVFGSGANDQIAADVSIIRRLHRKCRRAGLAREGQTPERDVVEVKAADDDAWLTADGDQVSRSTGADTI